MYANSVLYNLSLYAHSVDRYLLTAKPIRIVFAQKQVFGPRTVKSQPIWINFCRRLLLYGIYLLADLDCDRRKGGSRPNQNDYVFVILVTHHKSYI